VQQAAGRSCLPLRTAQQPAAQQPAPAPQKQRWGEFLGDTGGGWD
jgi:hypothetical protein